MVNQKLKEGLVSISQFLLKTLKQNLWLLFEVVKITNFSELSPENVKIYNEFIKSVKEARRAYQDKLVKQK